MVKKSACVLFVKKLVIQQGCHVHNKITDTVCATCNMNGGVEGIKEGMTSSP